MDERFVLYNKSSNSYLFDRCSIVSYPRIRCWKTAQKEKKPTLRISSCHHAGPRNQRRGRTNSTFSIFLPKSETKGKTQHFFLRFLPTKQDLPPEIKMIWIHLPVIRHSSSTIRAPIFLFQAIAYQNLPNCKEECRLIFDSIKENPKSKSKN